MVTTGRRTRELVLETTEADDHDAAEAGRQAARTAARQRLRQAIAGGDYDGLLDPALWRLFDTAAEATGFGREIGALRFAMARLLAEEEDPRQLATQLARVTTTIVRATQAQGRPTPTDDPVRSALLAEIDRLDGSAGEDDDRDDDECKEPETGGDDGW